MQNQMAMMEAMGRQEEYVTSAQNLKRDEEDLQAYQDEININSKSKSKLQSKTAKKQANANYTFTQKAKQYHEKQQ